MEHTETTFLDILRRLRVPVRDQATVGAAEHGVSTHVVVHVPTACPRCCTPAAVLLPAVTP